MKLILLTLFFPEQKQSTLLSFITRPEPPPPPQSACPVQFGKAARQAQQAHTVPPKPQQDNIRHVILLDLGDLEDEPDLLEDEPELRNS